MEFSFIAIPAQMHFSIPSVLLPANTLIITSFGKVHSQELLRMDLTQSSKNKSEDSKGIMFNIINKVNKLCFVCGVV